MTDDLRDSLQQAAMKGEPAVGDAFARFTAVRRRAAIARSAVVGVVGIAAAAVLMFTLPGLNSGDAGGNLTGGDATSAPNVRAVKHYTDPQGRFEFDYPAELGAAVPETWIKDVAFEVFHPDDTPQLHHRRPEPEDIIFETDCRSSACIINGDTDSPATFYVQVYVLDMSDRINYLPDLHPAIFEKAGVSFDRGSTEIAGRPATRYDATYPQKPSLAAKDAAGLDYWCWSCTVSTFVVDDWRPGKRFILRSVTDADDLKSYADELDVIVGSLILH